MSRPLRIEYPGAFYHAMNRGNSGQDLFKNKRDREKFLEYLETAVERFSLRIHAYCLMTNHYHLLLETRDANLSRAVQWINVSFAAYFNRKRSRWGHLSQFGQRAGNAKKRYRNFVEIVDPAALENPEKELTNGVILGTEGFVNWVKKTFVDSREDDREIPQMTDLKRSVKVETIIDAVKAEFGCTRAEILRKGRKGNLARDMAIYLARDFTGESAQRLGTYFGAISGAGITMRYKHMARQAVQSRRLRVILKKVRGVILNI